MTTIRDDAQPDPAASIDPASIAPASIDHASIDIWLTFLDDAHDPSLLDAYRALMSPTEREQQQRFVFEKDRHRYLVTRALVRTALSRYASVPAARLAFVANAYGKPALAEAPPDLAFNVSHAGNLVVLAVARGGALGVDTEGVESRIAVDDLADRYFAREEADELRTQPVERRQRRFFEYWTLKESYIKARGMGLSLPLDRFGFRFPHAAGVSLWTHADVDDAPQRWRFSQFATPGHLIALCAESAGPLAVQAIRCVPLAHAAPFALSVLRASD